MNWQEVLDWYRDPLFLLYPVASLLLSVGAFLLFALPWTYLAWKDPESLRKYKIQTRKISVEKWFWPSMGRIAVNSSLTLVLLVLAWPLLRLGAIHAGTLPAWYVILGQIVFFIFLDDFLYYWMHRAFHLPWLFKHIHSVHHRPVTPAAICGNYFHFVEFLATTSLVLVGPLLLGSHVVTLWIWIVFRQWEAADGHAGYDIPWSPSHWLPVYNGPAYHDFHHARYFGNYAGFLPYVDRLFGTYSKGYQEYEAAKKEQKAKQANGSD